MRPEQRPLKRSNATHQRSQAPSGETRPRVCVAGTLDLEFHRNRIILDLLGRLDWVVDLRTVKVWGKREDELVRRGKLRLALALVSALPRVIWRFLRAPKPDVLFVGYPGHFDMLWLALFAKIRGVPIVFDIFISLFDTVVLDRQLIRADSWTARVLVTIDRLACRLADTVLVDTPPGAEFLSQLSGSPVSKFRVLWVGAEEKIFHPLAVKADPRTVLFYGTYIPLHGIETIIRAAKLLEPEGLRFRLIGRGQKRQEIESLVREMAVGNVELTEPVSLKSLRLEIARAGICLGIFGTTPKASRVIPNKVYQAVAMARPVITADSPAIRTAFDPTEVKTVPAGDPEKLAAAIQRLTANPVAVTRLASAGHTKFKCKYSLEALSKLLNEHLTEARGGMD